MADRVRVYHPETDEAFDVPVAKATDLRLNKGWRSTPIDRTAEPAVKTIDFGRGTKAEEPPYKLGALGKEDTIFTHTCFGPDEE